VHGAKAFRDINLHHEDIQPANIVVLNNKIVKLIDVSFLNDGMGGTARKYYQTDYFSPLSPQALDGMMMGPKTVSYDKEKNDIWGIGMI